LHERAEQRAQLLDVAATIAAQEEAEIKALTSAAKRHGVGSAAIDHMVKYLFALRHSCEG
jgi:hypothetical protein